jgi:signal transduction histidine kinase
LVLSYASLTTIGQSFADRDWYQRTAATFQPYLSLPLISRATGKPVVVYAVPVLDEQGKLRGILTGGISLARLSDAITNIRYGTDTDALMIDYRGNGLILADRDPQLLLTPIPAANAAFNRLLAGERGNLETVGSDDEADLIGFAPVPDFPWGIMVTTASQTAFAKIDSLNRTASLVTGLIILVTAILGLILVLQITRPLRRLVEGAKEIGRGNLDYKIAKAGRNEIGDLSLAFGDMTEKLKNTLVSRDELAKEVVQRQTAEEEILRQSSIKEAINQILRDTLQVETDMEVARLSLTIAQQMTSSQFGWIGEINASGRLDVIALSNPGWESCQIEGSQAGKLIKNMEMRGIWSRVIKDGESLIANQPAAHPDRVGLPDGHPVLTSFLGVPLKRGGKTEGMIALANKPGVYNIKDQEAVESLSEALIQVLQRKRLERERVKFSEELKEKNIELERFTYTVSHDLKSPLVTIKTFLGYLKGDIAGTDARRIEQDMQYINGAADKMGKLLEELLEMSRIGRIVNPPVAVTFQELVQETLDLLAGRIEERGVKVQVSGEPVAMYGDRSRLVEIWQNLVENAVKFMGDQPSPSIDIGIEHHEQETVFFVRDNGMGIEPQYQSRLFNLFEKINPGSEGSGMGLAIVKRIVELYHGKIWVESQGLGQGTCFRFTLPGAFKDKNEGGKV